jgi:hypothetical protein
MPIATTARLARTIPVEICDGSSARLAKKSRGIPPASATQCPTRSRVRFGVRAIARSVGS